MKREQGKLEDQLKRGLRDSQSQVYRLRSQGYGEEKEIYRERRGRIGSWMAVEERRSVERLLVFGDVVVGSFYAGERKGKIRKGEEKKKRKSKLLEAAPLWE